MTKFSNTKNIDMVAWGRPNAPLLPKILRQLWSTEPLPKWVIEELNLKTNATYIDLGADIPKTLPISSRIKNFLSILIHSRAESIKNVRIFDRTWPVGLDPSDIPWTQRTINCLSKSELLNNVQKMMGVTFGNLFRIKNMGAASVLDYCCTLEASIDLFESTSTEIMGVGDNESPNDVITVLEEALSYPWAGQISHRDPRFASMIPLGSLTLKETIENLISEPDLFFNVLEVDSYCNTITKIKEYISTYENGPLEEKLMSFLKIISRLHGERLDALANRFGFSGRKPMTLDECGRRIGVSRERFRQIEVKFLKRIPHHPIFMPELDEALKVIEEAVPISTSEAMRLLRDRGISNVDFHPLALLESAKVFGRNSDLVIMSIKGNDFITTENTKKTTRLISSVARNLAAQSGATNVFVVTEEVNNKLEHKMTVDVSTVTNIIKEIDVFSFLDENWFWVRDIPERRNRLVNITNKMLSVVSPQNGSVLREGFKRYIRWRLSSHKRYRTLIAPPFTVMREFYNQHEDFSVEGDFVAPNNVLDYRSVLSDVEIVMFEILRGTPSGLLDRKSFLNQCSLRGVNEFTFTIFLSYSPIIDHVDIDIWKLRGTLVDPAAVSAMRQANNLRPREKRVIQYGWNPDGTLWIAVRIPNATPSLVVGCPSPIRKFLVGKKFSCYTKEGVHDCGTIAINDAGTSYGYGTFLRRYGLDENDVLLAEFDLSRQIVTLTVSDDNLLEEEL